MHYFANKSQKFEAKLSKKNINKDKKRNHFDLIKPNLEKNNNVTFQ